MPQIVLLVLLLCLLAIPAFTDALRLADGRPLVGCYFFGHWWEPWTSDDNAMERDHIRVGQMGVNTLFYDHEFSQSRHNNWKYLDREYKFAEAHNFMILPWLELKCGADLASHRAEALSYYGTETPMSEDAQGRPNNALLWDMRYQDLLYLYCCEYLDRYWGRPGLLRLQWEGKVRPAVALSVEVGWDGAGYDEATQQRFRAWLKAKYGSLDKLNQAWGTQYASFEAVDPRDTARFPYPTDEVTPVPQTTQDHAHFRAEVVNAAMDAIKQRLLRNYPDLLIIAEVPYPPGWKHPHAVGYSYGAASFLETVTYADIVVFRTAGPSSLNAEGLIPFRARGQKLVFAHRTGQGGLEADVRNQTLLDGYVRQALDWAEGVGFYSWNEMGDCAMVSNERAEGLISTYTRFFHQWARQVDRQR